MLKVATPLEVIPEVAVMSPGDVKVAVPIPLASSRGAFKMNFLPVESQVSIAFGVTVPLSKERAAFSVSAVALSELIIQLSDDVLPVAIVP